MRNANGKVVKKDLKPMLIEAWERQTLGMTNGKRSCLSKL